MDNFNQNLIFLKLKLVYETKRTTNSSNFKSELLHGEVGEAELNFMR
jgi:hypothetical protein